MSEPFLLPDVKKLLKGIKGKYYLEETQSPVPTCEGCFNVSGFCGTPCVDCERKKAWNKEWIIHLWTNDFIVWKRRKAKE